MDFNGYVIYALICTLRLLEVVFPAQAEYGLYFLRNYQLARLPGWRPEIPKAMFALSQQTNNLCCLYFRWQDTCVATVCFPAGRPWYATGTGWGSVWNDSVATINPLVRISVCNLENCFLLLKHKRVCAVMFVQHWFARWFLENITFSVGNILVFGHLVADCSRTWNRRIGIVCKTGRGLGCEPQVRLR